MVTSVSENSIFFIIRFMRNSPMETRAMLMIVIMATKMLYENKFSREQALLIRTDITNMFPITLPTHVIFLGMKTFCRTDPIEEIVDY